MSRSNQERQIRPLWHAMEAEAVAQLLETGPLGLLPADVGRQLERYGPNQLPDARSPSRLRTLLHQFTSPLVFVLLAAAIVSLALGHLVDAAVIGVVLLLNAVIGFAQEYRAELSVQALMRLAAPHARVIRNGREREVPSRDLVPGDVVLLETGVRVPADLRLFSVTGLQIDESLLTGEASPVAKSSARVESDTPLADRLNLAYSGTVATTGRARGYVVATGGASELGAIAEGVRREPRVEPPLQLRLARFARVIGLVVLISAGLAFLIGILTGRGVAEMFMTAVALAVSAVPEGLPVACTITLALGVRRMARRRAIVRRLAAVETLGSTTVIGVDKTGTLTENRMTATEAWTSIGLRRLADTTLREGDPLHWLLLAGVLSNEAEIYLTDGEYSFRGDPTEAALLIGAARLGLEPEAARHRAPPLSELPFEAQRQYSASVREHDGRHWLFVKGAAERVLPMCRTVLGAEGPMAHSTVDVQGVAEEMGARGLRVLALAAGRLADTATAIPADPRDLTFLGLIGLKDPPRAGVREAIAACRSAGIDVVMITGDHASTARAIGRELGLVDGNSTVLTGRDLDTMDDQTLARESRETTIYARVSPEHKLRVVRALHARNQVVAITGDGVNDAPALKAADIGIAMGRSGTDVAREAADIVLVDDNFVSIRAAVEEGRVTFDNIRKVTFFLVSTNVAEVLSILAALLLGWPLPLLAVQLLWLNLVTEGIQHLGLAFEAGDPGVLRRPPRPREEGLLSPVLWERTVLSGAVQAAGTLALFRWELVSTGSLPLAQTVALTTLALFQMFQLGNARSEVRSVFTINPFANPFLLLATATALMVHVAALYFRPTQVVLHVVPLEQMAWLRIVAVAATIILAVEVHKWLRRATRNP